ncbi:MAG: hypothetical protein AB8B99_16905 [Phormidesmis sp.]
MSEVGDTVTNYGKKHHCDDEVNHDGVNGVGIGEVVFVERRQEIFEQG